VETGSAASVEALTESLKRAVSALEAQGVRYLLGGGLGCWARGGPPSSNDIDLMLEAAEAERALEALADAGLRAERPPEQWLFKAWDDEILIDLIFEPAGLRITSEVLERGEELSVAGMYVRVMALEDILVTKLLALDEHSADYRNLLQIGRALREQIDWSALRKRTAASPFARAFFELADGLRISSPDPSP
jgi:predicted nucleotidyltransferase